MSMPLRAQCGDVLNYLMSLENCAELAGSVITHSPTGNKNAEWVHLEPRSAEEPAWLLYHIRLWSPEVVLNQIEEQRAKLDLFLSLTTKDSGYAEAAAVAEFIVSLYPRAENE